MKLKQSILVEILFRINLSLISILIIIIVFLDQSSVDRMLKRGNASMMVGASSWKDQFLEAFTVQAGKSI